MSQVSRAVPRVAFAAVLLLFLLPWSWRAGAQEPVPDHSCTASVAYLETVPVGSDGANFESHGWGFEGGGGIGISPPPAPHTSVPRWFITGNYVFTKLQATPKALGAAQVPGATSAHGAFSSFSVDVGPRIAVRRAVGVEGTVGFGWLRRGITFNGPSTNTLLQSSYPTLGRTASNSGVFDAALALTFTPDAMKGLSVFVEGRMLHGLAINRTTTLVPASVGIRW